MSNIDWAFSQDLAMRDKAVLVAMAFNRDRGGRPLGPTDLSRMTGMSERSVKRHVTNLRDAGMIDGLVRREARA